MCENYYTGSLSPNQPASETVAGIVEIATTSDVSAGTNDTKVITPLKLKNVTNGLQQQIDTIQASSDVKDIVGNYQELLSYDTSTLGNNDIIKVLDDETHDNERSYYRWVITGGVGAWVYVGSENSKKFTAQNPLLTPDASNKATWIISNTLNTADVIVQIKKVSDDSVVSADIISTTSTITIVINAENDISADTYKAVVIG